MGKREKGTRRSHEGNEETRTNTDDGQRFRYARRKSGEKRRRKNKKKRNVQLRAMVSLCRKERIDHAGKRARRKKLDWGSTSIRCPQEQDVLFKYMHYLILRFVRQGYRENEAAKVKAKKRCRKREAVLCRRCREAQDSDGGR